VNRRKLIGVVASVAVALVGTFVILKSSNSSKPAPAALAEPSVKVLKVVKPVPKGTASNLLGDAVQQVDVPASQRSAGAAESVADLTGLVSSTDLVPDEQVMKARFITAAEQNRENIATSGGSGLMGVWISLEPLRALGGRIQPGDQVAVVASFVNVPSNGGNAEGAVPATAIMLHKVPVLEVVGGVVPVAAPTDGSAAPATVAPVAPLLIKLGVTAGEAERLIYAMNNGALWLADEANDVPEVDTKVVVRDNVYDPGVRRTELAPLPAAGSTAPAGSNPLNSDPFAAAAGTPAAGAAPTTKAPAAGAAPVTTKAPAAGAKPAAAAPAAPAAPVTTKAPAAAAAPAAAPATKAPAAAAVPGAPAAPASGAQQ
jgi:pilus assembly protein CpaB